MPGLFRLSPLLQVLVFLVLRWFTVFGECVGPVWLLIAANSKLALLRGGLAGRFEYQYISFVKSAQLAALTSVYLLERM